MGYTIQKLDDLPAVLVSFDENFRSQEEMSTCASDLLQFFDQSPIPVYQIVDITSLKLEFDSVLALVQLGMKRDTKVVGHPNNLETIIVTDSRFYQMAAKGMNTASFGYVRLQIYETIEGALNYVREQTAASDGKH